MLLALGAASRCLGPTRPSTNSAQTRAKIYEKDLDFSYKPFLPILGSGLVTANGSHWQKQRLLMAPALRIDMLDAIIPIAKRAVDRLSSKLEGFKGTGLPGQQALHRGCVCCCSGGLAWPCSCLRADLLTTPVGGCS